MREPLKFEIQSGIFFSEIRTSCHPKAVSLCLCIISSLRLRCYLTQKVSGTSKSTQIQVKWLDYQQETLLSREFHFLHWFMFCSLSCFFILSFSSMGACAVTLPAFGLLRGLCIYIGIPVFFIRAAVLVNCFTICVLEMNRGSSHSYQSFFFFLFSPKILLKIKFCLMMWWYPSKCKIVSAYLEYADNLETFK